MIVGKVNADYEPIIRVAIHDSNGMIYERDAVIDTGFDGWLSLPPSIAGSREQGGRGRKLYQYFREMVLRTVQINH